MKKSWSFVRVVGWMMFVLVWMLPLHADEPAPPDAATQARIEIQVATDALNAALLRGDAETALSFLAPDFELGHHQYRKRDLAWIRHSLPRELAIAHFAELSVALSTVEFREDATVARGQARILARLNAGDPDHVAGMSGDYQSSWVKTGAGWRLKSSDQIFNALVRLSVLAGPSPEALWTARPHPVLEAGRTAPTDPDLVLEQSHQREVRHLLFSSDGATLATYSVTDDLQFASAVTGVYQKMLDTPMFVNSMTCTPDGKTLVTGHNDGTVRLWDWPTGTLQRELSVSRWSVYAVCVAADNRTLAVDGAGEIQLWDMTSGSKLKTLGRTQSNIRRLSFSPDGKMLAAIVDGALELWDVAAGQRVRSLLAESWVAFLPDGKTIVTEAGWRLRFRNLSTGIIEREARTPNPFPPPSSQYPPGDIRAMNGIVYEPHSILSPDGNVAATIYQGGSIGLWDVQTGTLRRHLRGFQDDVMGGGITTLTFSPDGTRLGIGSRDGEVALWNVPRPEH